MDFASILGAEIKKRKSATPSTTDDSSAPPKKYLKRAEIEAQREAEYRAEQARLERERAEKAAARRAAEEAEEAKREEIREKKRRLAEESRRKREEEERLRQAKMDAAKGKTSSDDSTDKNGETLPDLTDEQAIEKLRSLKEPAKLFGETPLQRLKRLKKLESGDASSPEGRSASKSPSRTVTPKVVPPPLTEEEMMLTLDDIKNNKEKVYRQLESWFRLVLREWDMALASRPQSVKTSFPGKAATNAYTQASTYMEPLFRLLKKQDLHPDIFPKVCEIVYEAQQRRYVAANDIYLRLSIGNAAWPIGVTMVGIHERSAREKLHEKGMAAHIMSDEITRKYLQSIKRCLSFCQTRWPPYDQLQLMG